MADTEVKDDVIEESIDDSKLGTANESVPVVPTPTDGNIEIKNNNGSVTLSSEEFSALMDRLANLEKDQKDLLSVQDKDKIAKIESLRRQGKLVSSVKVRRLYNKYIIGWKTIEDEVYKDENGRLIEKQVIRIFFEDDTTADMSMRQWASAPEYVAFEVIGKSQDADGNEFYNIKGADGKELSISTSFIN